MYKRLAFIVLSIKAVLFVTDSVPKFFSETRGATFLPQWRGGSHPIVHSRTDSLSQLPFFSMLRFGLLSQSSVC